MMKQHRFIIRTLLIAFLLMTGALNKVWATDVTYHILTLPIDNSIYHMKAEISGKRLEAFKVTVKGQTQLELPTQYKSPLATGFTYYKASDVTKSGSAVKLFDATDNSNKGYTYVVRGEDTPGDTSDDATPVAEGSDLPAVTADYYVVYTYNSSNTIAQLNGSVKYNINIVGYDKSTVKEKGFMAYNRGRNNRPAILPKGKVDPEMLASEDFMKVDVSGTSVSPYWRSGDNKNKEALTSSKFHFMFKFEGVDPYNIIIRTAYAKDTTYIEKNDNSNNEFVYKFYKEGSLFANGTANTYFASDEHRHYNYAYNSSLAENPTNLTEGTAETHTGWDAKNGYYHGQKGAIWNSFALLNNSKSTGYVLMGTRTVDGNGNTPDAPSFLKEANTCNNLVINKISPSDATNNLTIEGLYPIKKVTFKVVTSFRNEVSVADWVSQYTVDNDPIETKYLPDALKRKYCTFNGKFYKDAACTQEITHFSKAVEDPTEGYQVYVGYTVSPSAPKFLSPSASSTTATWYELTDDGSVQESGRKIKWNGDPDNVFKNNGANGEYVKESEFALVGDPYELKVLYREASNYVTLSGHNTWEMPNDDTSGSFLLREYNGTGYWNWNTGHVSANVTYHDDPSLSSTDKNAQTVTINISGLTDGKFYGISTGGDVSQIASITPSAGNVRPETGTTQTIVVRLNENTSGVDKTITVTIQEYNDGEGSKPSESPANPSVITITQGTASSSFAGNTVEYSTTNSTRVKVLDLPKLTYTYNIVDKSGRIAVKATAKQTIFSTLSLASIPSIIVSPFLLGETVTFYDDNYVDGNGRGTLTHSISETPNVADDIYVTYTTAGLVTKPIKLGEDQEFNVVLNGQYLYCAKEDDKVVIKTNISPTAENLKSNAYLWKLRNRDPYAMLIDNMGARVELSVAELSETPTVYDDEGTSSTPTRQKGAWVKLTTGDLANAKDLEFTTDRGAAQRFIAKASTNTGIYEVMVATGSSIDASTTYYNIGRSANDVVQIYDKAHYAHGNDVLKFRLEQSEGYRYHLIDKSKHELLVKSSKTPDLALPAEYQSPLVAEYHYYDPANMNISEGVYEVKDSPTELTSIEGLYATFNDPESSNATDYDGADAANKHEATSTDNMNDKARQLTTPGYHFFNVGGTYYKVYVIKPLYNDIYVTYDVNDLIGFNNSGRIDDHPYLLKFLDPLAEGYFLEDGADKLTASKIQAVYPYCNGDGNLNIYGQLMRDEQMGGGSSTRPRWVWFFESTDNDPYHVKIRSRSTIAYSGVSHPTYLSTYAVHFNQSAPGVKTIVTGGTLPGISSIEPTEYIIVGSEGAYKLMTTKEVEGDRRMVNSLEQYWKTYNMAKLHVLGISNTTDAYSDDESTWTVPTDPDSYRITLEARGWHSYDAYANATRWNGFNDKASGHEKKVVEKLEHWFQTFDMGNGSFMVESADIPPVLVLLDLHGWEIMRLPLPTTNYPEGETERNALRKYDSPWVKEYKFYSNATKASGCHKYTLRLDDKTNAERDQIKDGGVHYTSHSLGDLPPLSATGVKSSGVFNDQFVTYTVKEEYKESYDYTCTDNGDGSYTEEGTPSKFLVLLGSRFLRDNSSATGSAYNSKPIYEASEPVGGNIYDAILDPQRNTVSQVSTNVDADNNGIIDDINLWYVQPNLNIDKEMGIKWGTSDVITGAEPLSEFGTKMKYKDITDFDPYNIQLKNVYNSKFLTTHHTSANLDNGIMIGDYSDTGGTTDVTLETEFSYAGVDPMVSTGSVGYDHTNLKISNQTFMAVSDANGNLQLMPRFDHTKRINLVNNKEYSFTTLEPSEDHAKASAESNASMGTQTVFFVRPQVMEYHIIDNEGNEALRYKRAGDLYPAITEHFKSPLAKDFKYYKTTPTYNAETKVLTVTDEITGSFAAKDLDAEKCDVYVRYSYDEEADLEGDKLLQGQWFTIKLDNKDVQSSGTIKTSDGTGVSLYADAATPTKPAVNEAAKKWQWKFLRAPADPSSDYYRAPDPYAVQLFNRAANYSATLEEPNPMSIPIKVNGYDRFALLKHPSEGYALAVDGLCSYDYQFLNGASMTDPGAGEPQTATTAVESGFKQKTGEFDGIGAQLLVNDEVEHNYTYHVINNSLKEAITAPQTHEEADAHQFAPYLPESAQTPLLRMKDYEYYGTATESTGTYTVDAATKLFTLYGLYDDKVYVRYKAYDMDSTEFKVPNKKDVVDGKVAKHAESHDVAMNINGGLPYNIIWENDNMMQSTNGSAISDGGSQSLSGTDQYVWYFTGNDPYAIKIKHKGGNYVDGDGTMANEAGAKEFMLLKKAGYDYGILQETGATNKLSGYGQTTTTGDPTKYIIFGLSTGKLIYHLVIANTCPKDKEGSPESGQYVDIPYKAAESGKKRIYGTTQRDLSTYPIDDVDAGTVSIGDKFLVPNTFYRPNCTFEFYIEGVYDDTSCSTPNTSLNAMYKGLLLQRLMSDADLIGKTVKVNVVYQFDQDVATNTGTGFVTSTDDRLWYSFETTIGDTPYMVRYTNNGGMAMEAGRTTHYTNDYLWTPVGDVYGFKMFNRYMLRNMNEGQATDLSKVMTTASLATDAAVRMGNDGTNAIYELVTGDLDGYFRVRPVANTSLYIKKEDNSLKLSNTPTDWRFGLDIAMLQPFYVGAGCVGGLTPAGKTAYETAEATGKIAEIQKVVYNIENIVPFTTGYYRLHSQPGIPGISPVRYASGYLHDIEKTAESGDIPMHFYSKEGASTDFETLETGFTVTNATRGEIPIAPTENDPSTIFYIVKGADITNPTIHNVTMSTQGLNVIDNKMGSGAATALKVMDIGGGIVLIHDGAEVGTRNYLNYDQGDGSNYDLKFDHDFQINDVKWSLQPVQKTAEKGDNEMPLVITTNQGGDGYYYATLYLPYDVLLPADGGGHTYNAYVCTKWYDTGVHPAPVPAVSPYAEGKLVPAGTPVIIRTNDESGSMTLTLPNTTTSPKLSCVFTGSYLEQLLALDAAHDVYTLGLPFTSTIEKAGNYNTTGDITSPLPEQANNGVGFYINATPNKEVSPLQSLWHRNNRYVLHNKIYYRATGSGARQTTRGADFVPVVFDGAEEALEPGGTSQSKAGDGCAYDLLGRKVATREEVSDGSWWRHVAPGIYIVNGHKLRK